MAGGSHTQMEQHVQDGHQKRVFAANVRVVTTDSSVTFVRACTYPDISRDQKIAGFASCWNAHLRVRAPNDAFRFSPGKLSKVEDAELSAGVREMTPPSRSSMGDER
jgi:hypothetical protein